ncbi:MAG: hypothetical protein R3281_02770 [Balneolaceae bacterium]|nr:hypothetical protein [Balneolaceae bacterium]
MKKDTHETYQKLKNDLERMVPDSELEYSEEDLLIKPEPEQQKRSEFWEDTKRFTKNFVVATLCVIITLLWWFDWNVSALASRTSEAFSGLFGEPVAEAPAPPSVEIPPIPELPDLPADIEQEIRSEIANAQSELNMGMTDYLSALEEAGYRDRFSMPAITTMYQAGVEISYLDELNSAGLLEQLSFPAIVTFYNADVSTEYLIAIQQGGYLEQFGFPGVAALSAAEVPVSYLDNLKEKGLLDDLSFTDILIMYESE